MTTVTLDEVWELAQQLPPVDQRRLIELLSERREVSPRRSIRELEGLGAELWHSVDSTAYLNEERNAWDG